MKAGPGERRNGADVHSEATVPLSTAILGGRVVVETARGRAVFAVPPRCPPGTEFRLRGAGMLRPDGSRGDHVVRIRVEWPRQIAANQARVLREWEGEGSAPPAPKGLLRRLWPFRRGNLR